MFKTSILSNIPDCFKSQFRFAECVQIMLIDIEQNKRLLKYLLGLLVCLKNLIKIDQFLEMSIGSSTAYNQST